MSVGGVFFWIFIGSWLLGSRSGSRIHKAIGAGRLSRGEIVFLSLIIVAILLSVYLLMPLSPLWIGDHYEYLKEYEEITESFLQGRLDFGYAADPSLLALENPYDPELRMKYNVVAHWDHAYYREKYYMYFGVVPVLIFFLPYRLLFGRAPTTWRVTCLFSFLYILGLTIYFLWLAKRFYHKMTWGALLGMLIAFAFSSVLYAVKYPTLYMTPISCGMMLEIWSLYFYSRAVWEERSESSSLRLAHIGAWLGALTFGCRPTLALANLLVLPMLVHFLKGKKISGKLLFRLVLAASPYLIVAAGLMWYNYARFDNPFEFGQAYQLTEADQTAYGEMFTLDNLYKAAKWIPESLFALPSIGNEFPFLQDGGGAFSNCPLLLISFLCFLPSSLKILKEKHLLTWVIIAFVSVLIIITFQALWSPFILSRYLSDFLWLLSICAFIGAGLLFHQTRNPGRLSCCISLGSLCCVLITALIFLIPEDGSYTICFPEELPRLWNMITMQLN